MSLDFDHLKQAADGLLSPRVYAEIYRSACEAPEGAFVEVGAAHGASTIALALAIKHAGRSDRVVTFETGNEMKRKEYRRENAANLRILDANLKQFDVADCVTVLTDKVSSIDWPSLSKVPISLLLLDADGVIDRDFRAFYNHLRPGAVVIIDDYVGIKDLNGHGYNPLGKQYSTCRYVDYFIENGLLDRLAVIDRTFFGLKPASVTKKVRLDVTALDAIRTSMQREREKIDAMVDEVRAGRASREWLDDDASVPDLRYIPSMTHPRVLKHLYSCAKNVRGVGDVVEVGSWLGSSCAYMAAGIRNGGANVTIHCFDQWKATEYEVNRAAGRDKFCSPEQVNVSLSVGQDLSAIFLNNVIPIYPRVKATKTEIGKIEWNGRWIELLHDDGSKYAANYRHVLRTFGPSFIPGVTILILSDYYYWKQPHCPEDQREILRAQAEIMEGLADHFEMVWDADVASAATFLYTKPLDFTSL